MSAKEMFEELGFKYRTESYKEDKIIEIEFSDGDGTWITISKSKIEYVEKHNKEKLPLKLLPAINKQIEELGWND